MRTLTGEFESIYHCLRCKNNLKGVIILNCGHGFCKDCLGLWYIINLAGILRSQILVRCPNCIHILLKEEIEQIITGSIYCNKEIMGNCDLARGICSICGGGIVSNISKNDGKEFRLCRDCVKKQKIKADEDEKIAFLMLCPGAQEKVKVMIDEQCCECGKEAKDFICECKYSSCYECLLDSGKLQCLKCKKEFNWDPNKFRKDALERPKIKPCPGCNVLNNVSESDDQYFACNECQTFFCIDCSARKDDINVHGNSYHRSHCPKYDENHVIDGCPKCMDQECPKPGDLVDGDIPN